MVIIRCAIPDLRNRLPGCLAACLLGDSRAAGIHSACSSELLRASERERELPPGTLTYVGGGGGGGGVGLVETVGRGGWVGEGVLD